MGWTQAPTIIEEDNSACVDASNHTHMTKNLRHIDLSENFFKDKVADGTSVIVRLNTRCHLLAFAAKVEKQLQATVSIQ